ncbi:DEAD/DEAH box helicase family protein [Streptomyces sp. NPDC090073]|uniref:type I restriction endonuclease subunit R n=1 Tax=Streptomyces sp. NPDC090073 TaxID=3365936 RepID=UPI00380F37DD
MSQAPTGIDAKIGALASTSANFGFLLPIEPLLVLYGAGAESEIFTEPGAAASKAREFGHVLAVELARAAGLRPERTDLAGILRALTRAGVLQDRMLRAFEELRQAGRQPAGDRDRAQSTAFQLVRRCFELGVWFFRLRTQDREPIPFIPPQPNVDVSEALRLELEQARGALAEARVSFVDREEDRATAEEQGRLAASDELAQAASVQAVMTARVRELEAELEALRTAFDQRPLPQALKATQREVLIARAREAAREPFSEVQVRTQIDRMLSAAGWMVQDGGGAQNLRAARGVVVREVTTAVGRADYLLYVDRQLVGVIEAKHEGADLSAAVAQADRYAGGLKDSQSLQAWRNPLPYRYVSDGNRVLFRDCLDRNSRTRPVFSFHRPDTIARWMREAEADKSAETYRNRVREQLPSLNPELVMSGRLRQAQFVAVRDFESSLRHGGYDRSLIQMATGAGKTYTAVTIAYRLLKYAKAGRILFLVDRNNLGDQALAEFQNYTTPDDGRKFTELYNVDQLTGASILDSSKVVVSTIQRLWRLLADDSETVDAREYLTPSMFEDEERASVEEDEHTQEEGDDRFIAPPVEVSYNRRIPPESFDLIIIDECHRSIYGKWRSVIEYFDAHLLGLTATPVGQTYGFFRGNLVSSYTYEEAVADGVAVDYTTYRIRTDIAEHGSVIPVDEFVKFRNRRTRVDRYEQLDEELSYAGSQVGSRVISTDNLRLVLTTFRDNLIRLFPERSTVPAERRAVPKTLIFAKDDNHADEVVEAARAAFGKGDAFCKKITGRAKEPNRLLAEFRNTPDLRIAVTVDLIATGTDVRPIECVIFLRDVKSAAYYEQMRGRGSRTVDPSELRAVTPDVDEKTRFVVVDAVGVSESHKRETAAVVEEADPTKRIALKKLLAKTAGDGVTVDEAEELALRLARLSHKLDDEDHSVVAQLAGMRLDRLVNRIVKAVDVDNLDPIRQKGGEKAVYWEIQEAVSPLASSKELRDLLVEIRTEQRIAYDEQSADTLLTAEFVGDPESLVQEWRDYVRDNRVHLVALESTLSGRGGNSTSPREAYQGLKEFAARIARPPHQWTVERLWRAYEQMGVSSAEPGVRRGPADLLSLIRYELGVESHLRPYKTALEDRFANWVLRREQAGGSFSPDELWWLERIVDSMSSSVRFDTADLDRVPFTERGGTDGFLQVFGDERALDLLDQLDRDLA